MATDQSAKTSVSEPRGESMPTFNPYGLHAARVPLAVLTYPALSEGAKLLYGRLALFRGSKQDGFCNPALPTMAAAMAVSVDTVGRWLGELIAEKFIERRRRGRQRAECIFLAHPCFNSAELRNQDGGSGSSNSANLRNQEPPNSANSPVQFRKSAVPNSANLPSAYIGT